MADSSEAPSRTLRYAVLFIVEFLGTLVAVRTFGIVVGLIGAVGFGVIARPRDTRRRAYAGLVLAVAFIVAASVVGYQRLNALQVWEGVSSPPFAFTTIDGRRIDSNDLRGKRVALNFWATWCGPCQVEIPEINRLYVARQDSDVAVFGIANESEDAVRKFVAEHAVDYPLVTVQASELPSPFRDVSLVPTTFILDRNGVIQFVRTGFIGAEELRATIWEAGDFEGPTKSAPASEEMS